MSLIFRCASVRGIHAQTVEIEARREDERARLSIVGLPDTACRESRERVRAAYRTVTGRELVGHVIVSLAPAEVRKEGSGFDLAIALAVLAADGNLERRASALADALYLGELTLAGHLRAVRGTIAAAELARREGRTLVLPRTAAPLAALVPGVRLVGVDTLAELRSILLGRLDPRPLTEAETELALERARASDEDFGDVRGQAHAVRAALLAAAGGHDLLLSGPPGCGKSMIARRLPDLLPPLDDEEYLEVARVRTAAEALDELPPRRRPFRAPHHTTSAARLVGGGSPPRPGEISLAHQGVLFLDELPELPRHAIDALREPMECGAVTISRVAGTAVFPSRFQLVAAMNPCPCGWADDRSGRCRCTDRVRALYQGRVSGPIRDRIDLHVQMRAVPAEALEGAPPATTTAALRADVVRCRELQRERIGGRAAEGRPPVNARMSPAEITRLVPLDRECRRLLASAVDRLGLTARGRSRALVVARTIADLAGEPEVGAPHLREALSYRLPELDAMLV